MDIINYLGYLASATRFRRISERLYLDGDKIYSNAGITFKASWFSVFYVVAKSEQPVTILDVAHQIDFSHISVKNVVRELEKGGLVTVVPNPSDKRSKLISLSEQGLLLLDDLSPLWQSFSFVLKEVFSNGHPDILNILDRIDYEIEAKPIHVRMNDLNHDKIKIVDYKPSFAGKFYELAAPWLSEVLNGELEKEDQFTLNNPEKAYLQTGGFLFFAKYEKQIAGCVVLKRLDDDTFEFAKLFIDPNYRKLGIATKLIERCITRCAENEATELWLQTTMAMPQAHKLYYKLGFMDAKAPGQMDVLERTEKIMFKSL
ncbi:MAG: bifunctional helix-turn-helix transcriptional regulator/GNAT family N-acetyltransferase [Bacteroidota bacterium]